MKARGRSSSSSSKAFKDDDDDDDIGDADETAMNISDFLNDGDSDFPCGQCDFIAKGTLDLGQHLKNVHCEARPCKHFYQPGFSFNHCVPKSSAL